MPQIVDHSVTFRSTNWTDKRNTYTDWHLIPSSRPVIAPPPPQTNIIQIPGTDGSRDLSELATNRPLYGDRSGSIQFYLEPGYWKWADAYSAIGNYLHGQRLLMVLEDDPNFYYDGRFSVSQWQSDASWETITINYVCSPYKLRTAPAGENWKWDTLFFGPVTAPVNPTGTNGTQIVSYNKKRIRDIPNRQIVVEGYGMPVVPVVETTADNVALTMDGKTVTLAKKGKHDIYNTPDLAKLTIATGTHRITVSGDQNSRITFDYRGGSI